MLRQCFLASNHDLWLNNAFPFLLDKLTAAQTETKLECLVLLEEMVAKHAKEAGMREHLEFAIDAILNEYFNRFELDVQQHCSRALSSIVN